MSTWNRNQVSSYRPPTYGSHGGQSSGSQISVPDVSIRNHKRWKAAFDKVIGEFLSRGPSGVEQLAVLVRQAIQRRLDANPYCQNFKSFQLVSDLIGILSSQADALSLPGPIAFAKSEIPRSHLLNLTGLEPGRNFTRAVYRLFPVDHNGANSDKEFDIFLIRRGIGIWPIGSVQSPPLEGNSNSSRGGMFQALPPARSVTDATMTGKRRFESQGASHYSPPAQRRRPQIPTYRDLNWVKGSNSQPIGRHEAFIKREDDNNSHSNSNSGEPGGSKLPFRPVPTGLNPPRPQSVGAGGLDELDLFSASRRTSSSAGFTMPLFRSSGDAGFVVASQGPQEDKPTANTNATTTNPASAAALSVAGSVSSPVTAAPVVPSTTTPAIDSADKPSSDKSSSAKTTTIDGENMNEIIKQFTRDAAQKQKEIVSLRARITELETTLTTRDAEMASLRVKAEVEGTARLVRSRSSTSETEARSAFLEDRQALVRDQNKLALDRARFAAQVSNWAEKLGQVQQGLSQHMPPRNSSTAEGEQEERRGEEGDAQGA